MKDRILDRPNPCTEIDLEHIYQEAVDNPFPIKRRAPAVLDDWSRPVSIPLTQIKDSRFDLIERAQELSTSTCPRSSVDRVPGS